MLWLRFNFLALFFALASGLNGCGSDAQDKAKKGSETTTGEPGNGSVATASTGQASIDFSTAAAGAQFVLMPFILGDTATVTGATETKFTFTMSVGAAAAAAKLADLSSEASADSRPVQSRQIMSTRQRDDMLRTLLNRFDPNRGAAQGDDFWHLARLVDASDAAELPAQQGAAAAGFAAAPLPGAIEGLYRKAAPDGGRRRVSEVANLTMASSCPSAGGTVAAPNSALKPRDLVIPSAATSVVSSADYCIVYLSDPVTGGDKATIEATIKEVVRRFKEVIYKDTFAQVNGYTFRPVFIIADFSKSAQWPSLPALAISGAFIASMSDDTDDTIGSHMPMIYMASDISKVGKNVGAAVDVAKNKRLWHGTIAHETQHAIMNYYRARKVSADSKKWRLETAEVDEGIAHYAEDLFGHGAENFDDFAKTFLTSWFDKDFVNPVLSATDDKPLNRGAAQTLMYYLISQKGGVTFTNGVASGGTGLEYLASVVKDATSVGPKNLAEKFGGTWTDTIANFFGALAIDGSGLSKADAKYLVQDPQKATNLVGETDRLYGMHFNDFSGLEKAHTWTETATDGVSTPELQYYATCPYLYTVADPTKAVVFKTKDTFANTAVAVVQIK